MSIGKPDEPATTRSTARWTIALLSAGILLRLIIFATVTPIMPDDHAGVIRYIAEHASLPRSDALGQSYHPPLYHAAMALLLRATGSTWLVRFCSLVFSIANLLIIHQMLRNRTVVASSALATLALGIACFHPQLVMYGHFISNDTLTFLLGSVLTWQTIRYAARPTMGRMSVLACICGLGLLTKGTFFATGLALVPLVWVLQKRPAAAVRAVTAFCAVWVVLGCYKYVENAVHFGRPIVHNIDFNPAWAEPQRGMWRGLGSAIDVNVLKLIRSPILVRGAPLSIPLTLYGTFWYPHIPDFALQGNVYGYAWLGSVLFAAAVIPTIAMLIGCLRVRRPVEWTALLLVATNLLVVVAAGIRYDVWSSFHGRLLLQSMAPMLILLCVGGQWLWKWTVARRVLTVGCIATIAASLLYFVVELLLLAGFLARGAVIDA